MSIPTKIDWRTLHADARKAFDEADQKITMMSEHERLDANLRALERRGPIVCLPLMRLPSDPVDKSAILHMKELLARTLAWMKEW